MRKTGTHEMLDYIIRHVRGRKIYYGIRGKHKALDEIRLACSATAINVTQPKKLTKVGVIKSEGQREIAGHVLEVF